MYHCLLCIDRTFLTENMMKIAMLAKIPACEGGNLCTAPVLTRFGFPMKKMVWLALVRLTENMFISLAPFWNGLCIRKSLGQCCTEQRVIR
jgi:hypothetical protein